MQTLVVALDTSSRAEGVLSAALDLAERLDAKLILVRATAIPGELPPEAYACDPTSIGEVLELRAREDLERLARRVPNTRLGGIRSEVGRAWEVIDRVADEENADLVVIGAHGYGTVERWLGTIAAKVVNHAHRSVLVVREPRRVAPAPT